MIGVLIISGHPAIRAGLAHVINCEPGLRADVAESASAGVAAVPSPSSDVVLLDSPLAGQGAFDACHALKQLAAPRRVALYSDRAGEEVGIAA